MTLTAPVSHNTAQTRVVEAAGIGFAYRRFGRPAQVPLVMLQHFRGNLDNWDPALTDAFAAEREIILVDYPGVGSSTGEASSTIAEMARQMSDAARDAQYDAIVDWGVPDHGALQRLTGIQNPTLVVQGDNDQMIPTKLSHLLAGMIPEAQIRIYPDAAHGFLFQYPTEAAAAINEFLAADDEC